MGGLGLRKLGLTQDWMLSERGGNSMPGYLNKSSLNEGRLSQGERAVTG